MGLDFIILSDAEENDLLRSINLYIKNEKVCEFKIIKRGYSRGLWRKIKKNLPSHGEFQYMDLSLPKALDAHVFGDATDFALCLTLDLKHLAAVNYTRTGIDQVVYFPNGKYSDWRFLWCGYLAEVRDLYDIIVSLYVLHNSSLIGDPFNLVSAFAFPFWARRIIAHRQKNSRLSKFNQIFSNNFMSSSY